MKKPIGKQDQYMAAFGAFTTMEISRDGVVHVSHPPLTVDLVSALESNMMLFYTEIGRAHV